MRPFEGVVLVEGEPDRNGYTVAEGALSWRTPIPVYDADRRRILGHAYGVERVGREIRVVGQIDLPADEFGIAAQVSIGKEVAPASDESVATACRLIDAAITPTPSFLSARIRVDRDHIDAKVDATLRAGARAAYAPDPERDEEDDDDAHAAP